MRTKKLVLGAATAVLLAGVLVPVQSADGQGAPAPSSSVRAVARADTAFGVALLHRLAPTTEQNVTVSPASLAIALAMLQNGAAGDTQSQILSALRAAQLSPSTLDAGWAGLLAAWSQSASKGDFTLTSADVVWVQSGFTPGSDFTAALSKYFGAALQQADFAHDMPAALAAINAWVSDQTHGRIPSLFDSLDPATLMVLANAVFFQARWTSTFDRSQTRKQPFRLPSGARKSVPFLNTAVPTTYPAAITHRYDAVQLPYRGGRFAALVIMPRSGSLGAFTRSMTPASLRAIVAGLRRQPVRLSLPKFTTQSKLALNGLLQRLGMADAFTDHADFAPLSPNKGVKVGAVAQRDYLKVAEKGTTAAAATGVTIVPTAAQTDAAAITVDRPFLFLVRDVRTGALVFESLINDPSAG